MPPRPGKDVLTLIVPFCQPDDGFKARGRWRSTTDRRPQFSRALPLRAVTRLLFLCLMLRASQVGAAEILRLPPAEPNQPLRISALDATRWYQDQTEIWLLRHGCVIRQGATELRGRHAVIWRDRSVQAADSPVRATVYLEQDVGVVIDGTLTRAGHWLGHFESSAGVQMRVGQERSRADGPLPEIYQRAELARQGVRPAAESVEAARPAANSSFPPSAHQPQPAQFEQPLSEQAPWALPAPAPTAGGDPRRIQIRPRGSAELSFRSELRGDERVWVGTTPVHIRIFGYGDAGVVEIAADRWVVWSGGDVSNLGELGAQEAPVEFYLAGNIVFRQGEQVVYAERMYYSVREQIGVILHAELLADVPGFQGKLRMKADVLQQRSSSLFQANDAAVTTSRLGVPRYWVQSDALTLDTGRTPLFNAFTDRVVDPATGQPLDPDRLLVTAQDSAVFLGGWPVFYWPSFTTDLARDPSLYLDSLRFGNDSVFGTQIITRWNLYQILGITPPENSDWTASIDYLSDRGLGLGSDFEYQRPYFFDRPAYSRGFLKSWFIDDQGLDNLGADRRAVAPEEDFRGRILGRHRHETPAGYQFTAELGWISDRNFLEQYYEDEWDTEKDYNTGLQLKRVLGNGAWSVNSDIRVNDFFTQTEWLPRFDHFQLGQSFLADRITWFEHSQIGYGRLEVGDSPTNPVDLAKYDPLAWETPAQGIRAATRQEVDVPVQLGAARVVPYLLGEIAYWQEDLASEQVTRLLGQAGVRTSVPFWRVDPTVRDELFNLHGLAHKMVLDAEYFWADADQNLTRFPLYDPLDDDSIEFFRRRLLFDTFGGTFGDDVPLKYDERTFALRSAMQRFVTAPSTEIADDLMMVRLGARHRLQTKRGVPGQQRIVDWLTFHMEGTYFPRANRDNFGQEIGPATYDMRWHLGDRVTMLSDGYFDFFGQGLRTVSLGSALTRPGQSQYYLGFRSIEGPISSTFITSSASYRISQKWIVNYGSLIDLSETGNIGQVGNVVRVGESFLVSLGFHYDNSRDNFGVRFGIEPRFLKARLGRIGGRPIPPVGALGLE